MTKKRRRFRFFDDDDERFSLFEDIDELFRRELERTMKLINKILKESSEMPGQPVVYGLRITIGPDGVPRIQTFGNIKHLPAGEPEVFEPSVDVLENEDEVQVIVEIPGASKESIKVKAKEDEVYVEARAEDRKYAKRVKLPAKVDPKSARATFKNGILTIRLKKLKKDEGFDVKVERFFTPASDGCMRVLQTGTTTVALKFSDGVVLAADRRVSISTGLVVSRSFTKIVPLTDYVAMTVSGLVADAQKLSEFLYARIRRFELERRRRPLISELARFTGVVMHSYLKSYAPLLAHIIIGGIDVRGPHIFFLDEAGSALEDDFLASGSGSPVAYGYLEAAYRPDLSESEAIGIAVRAINSAIMRDLATGDGIDVVVISRTGFKRLSDEEVKKFLMG